MAAEEVVVVLEPPSADIGFEVPLADGMGQAELGLDRPSIGSDVDQLVRQVLPGGRAYIEAQAQGGLGLALREFTRRHGGSADEVHGKAQLGVAEPLARHRSALFTDVAAGLGADVGQYD